MTQDLKFKKLYNLINRIVESLEEEVDLLDSSKLRNSFTVKKSTTDILAKLVTIVAQLEKLDKEKSDGDDSIVSSFDDKKIIELFLAKYKSAS